MRRLGRWTATIGLLTGLAILTVWSRPTTGAQNDVGGSTKSRLQIIREQAKNVKSGLSTAEAVALAKTVAEKNVGVSLMGYTAVPTADTDRLAEKLASRQLKWQEKKTKGIDPQRLITFLDHELGLGSYPDYLQLHTSELNRVRLSLWIQVPELSGGTERSRAKSGMSILANEMSPIEAFVAADSLVFQKTVNDDFLTTDEERTGVSFRLKKQAPGLRSVQRNPRKDEFVQALFTSLTATAKNPSGMVDAIDRVMENSYAK